MKTLLAITFLSLATPVFAANQYDPPINTSGELLEWCQQESQATFLGKGITPYNWTASHWDEADTLFVKGSWRIDTKEVTVKCSVGRGARRSYAVMSILDPK